MQQNQLILEAIALQKCIKATYSAGYTTIPDDLKFAVYITYDALIARSGQGNYISERFDNYSYQLADTVMVGGYAFPGMAAATIQAYARPSWP